MAGDNDRSTDHLIESILTRNSGIPNFALLLGSGASTTSRVPTASDLIQKWRRLLYEHNRGKESFKDWLTKQEWFNSEDEYALLFEAMYDQPSLRRTFIEETLQNAHPCWGYVYLTNLLAHNIFNVVFTVNFDDLIQEACYLYSDSRPIVCAHDSAVSGIRVTAARPKIIKLHGDYLFDNIKNTVKELETLEENMKRKFMQFAQEYGLVVVGYSGRDRSVMDILDMFVKHEEYFKQGIYWCERSGEPRGKRLSNLLHRDKVYSVPITGFDEFMAELHHKAGLPLPEPVANPIWIAKDRSQLFLNIPETVSRHEIIANDINAVMKTVDDIMSLRGEPKTQQLITNRIPASLRAASFLKQKKLANALEELEKAYKEDPSEGSIAYEIADTLRSLNRIDELASFVPNSSIEPENKTYFLLFTKNNESVIHMANKVLSINPSGSITRINRAIALKRLRRIDEMENDLDIIENESPTISLQCGIAALRGHKKEMLQLMKASLDIGELTVNNIKLFPIFEDYQQDKDVIRLINTWKRTNIKKHRKNPQN